MAQGTIAKEDAVAMLEAGRRELSAEAEWLRRKLSPQRIVRNAATEHPYALVGTAAAIGLLFAIVVAGGFRSRSRYHERQEWHRPPPPPPPKPKVGLGAYLAGLAFKFFVPSLAQSAIAFFLGQQVSRGDAGYGRHEGGSLVPTRR